jgi:hypothetical protein
MARRTQLDFGAEDLADELPVAVIADGLREGAG